MGKHFSDKQQYFHQQAQLLVRVLPIIAQHECFALKGGTAINLFVRDLPRISVDIDLVYLPIEDRNTSLDNIHAALLAIVSGIQAQLPDCNVKPPSVNKQSPRLLVTSENAQIKIELSPVLRGTVNPAKRINVSAKTEEAFGYAEIQVSSFNDLYAGKLCATLDRQHPRDLFDIKLLLENEGINRSLIETFLVYLISHNRPIAELVNPNRLDIHNIFETEFASMTQEPVTIEDLEATREHFIQLLQSSLTEQDKQFLLSFKAKTPDWSLLPIDNAAQLPAVKWKLLNLNKMPDKKHMSALKNLEQVLNKL